MKNRYLILVSIILLILSFFIAFSHGRNQDKKYIGGKVQNIFTTKQQLAIDYLNQLRKFNFDKSVDIAGQAEKKGISFLVFKGSNLLFWSDNRVPQDLFPIDSLSRYSIIVKPNAKYGVIAEYHSDTVYLAVIKLEANYPYQNKFLKNGIDDDFKVSSGEIIVDPTLATVYDVFNLDTSYAFSIALTDSGDNILLLNSIIASVLFLLGFFLLLVYSRDFLLKSKAEKLQLRILIFALAIGILRILLLVIEVLDEHFYLFDPFIFATKIAPTFGDLVLNTMVFVFYAYLVFHFLTVTIKQSETNTQKRTRITLLNLLYVLVFLYGYIISKGIITHSSINFIPQDISQIRFPLVAAIILFAVNFFSVMLIGLAVYKNLAQENKLWLTVNCAIILLVVYFGSILIKSEIDIYSICFGVLLYLFIVLFKDQIYSSAFFSAAVIFLLLFSVYILFFTVYYNGEKEKQKNKTFAVSLSNEHDAIAEYLLENISAKLMTDTSVMFMFYNQSFDAIRLSSHLNDKYFGGYLKKYNTRITVCTPSDSVLLENLEYKWFPCYDYFNSVIREYGIAIPSSPFYYLDNYPGLTCYMGSIKYIMPDGSELALFFELESKFTNEQIGYPELLLDQNLQNSTSDLDFESSYAKYFKGNLISQRGKFDYSLRSTIFERKTDNSYYTVRLNGYNHLVYKPDNNITIIISEKALSAIEMVVLFSYIFVFYYLLLLLIIFMMVSEYRQLGFSDSLRNKIQFIVIMVLLVSLILIAGSTTWFNIRKYNQTQIRNIQEKMQSVYVEMDHKFSDLDTLTSDWKTDKYDNLDQLLIKFSDVFYSDINLYNTQGDLIATSRAEIFQLELQNTKIDPLVFSKLHYEQLSKFIHREHINKLNYLSAYVPYFNANGKLLAYINLPYFTRQKELQDEITTLTVTIINIYVLLILFTIIVVVIISNQITKPLDTIRSRFRGLRLGGKYEKINYDKNDEIGELVREYNNMVSELERSIELLAKSERELAWREMAKQVAHEIKNPLTPMKLSVQQLKRAWSDKNQNFDAYFQRVSDLLIEQIDTLSAIASEFSNFAKMPEAKLELVDLGPILRNTAELFANEQVKINLQLPESKILVKADSEQLSRVFLNIVKNGIQSIPENVEGVIDINLFAEEKEVVVSISDNGKGIPDDIKPKLFTPNFTTKTSGMGLGLAIVKNILVQINGRIEFETQIDFGSTFRIYIPIVHSK